MLCGNGGWIVSPTKLLPDCRNGQNKKENHAEGVFGHEMIIMAGTPAPLLPSLRKPQERQENDGPIVQHNQVRKTLCLQRLLPSSCLPSTDCAVSHSYAL